MAEFRFRLVFFFWFTGLTCFGLVRWLNDGDGFYLCMSMSGVVVLLLLLLMAIQDIRYSQPAQTVEDRGDDEPSEGPPG